jgi:predicted negative regulator of RcsB-dependent stress response
VDKVHRQELKHDKFVEQVGHTVEYAAAHRQQMVRYGLIALAVLVVGLGTYFYMRYQAGQRQLALADALQVQQAVVGEQANPFVKTFSTEKAKTDAANKAWQDLIARYGGSDEAMVAHFYLGINAADTGDLKSAEQHLKQVADSGDDTYASQARLSLANVYEATGRLDEAEKVLRQIIDDPSVLVTKEQATLALARVMSAKNPQEARKLLEPLRTASGAVSRAAISALGEIPAAK